jgi:hypothetical protein
MPTGRPTDGGSSGGDRRRRARGTGEAGEASREGRQGAAPAGGGAERDLGSPAEAAAHQIERLRALRAHPSRDLSIVAAVAAAQRHADTVQRTLGELIRHWEALVPEELASRTQLVSLRGGVLRVSAETSSVAFQVDRLMREGALDELRRRFSRPLTRVRVTAGTT